MCPSRLTVPSAFWFLGVVPVGSPIRRSGGSRVRSRYSFPRSPQVTLTWPCPPEAFSPGRLLYKTLLVVAPVTSDAAIPGNCVTCCCLHKSDTLTSISVNTSRSYPNVSVPFAFLEPGGQKPEADEQSSPGTTVGSEVRLSRLSGGQRED